MDEAKARTRPIMPAMKKLSAAVIVVAVLSLGVSGWLLSRYDGTATPEQSTTSTSTTAVDPETTVETTVPLVVVPNEVGKNGFYAAVGLKLANLKIEIVRAPSVTIAIGNVISQSPEQGTEVPEGTVIELTISSGPP